MGIVLASNFDVKTNLALDSRTTKDTIADRNNIPSNIRFEGLECYVKEDGCIYRLTGGIENSNWTLMPYAKDYMPVTGGKFIGPTVYTDSADDRTTEELITESDEITYITEPSATIIRNGSIIVDAYDEYPLHNSNQTFYEDNTRTVIDSNGFLTQGFDYSFYFIRENCQLGMNNTINSGIGNLVVGYSNNVTAMDAFVHGHSNNIIDTIDDWYISAMGVGLKNYDDINDCFGVTQIFGMYNKILPEETFDYQRNVFVIGVGTSDTDRKNGLVLYPTGNLEILGDLKLFAGTDNEISSIKDYIDNIIVTANGLRYKGTIAGSSTSPGTYTAEAKIGDLYIVSTAGYVNGIKVEIGDMVICSTDTAAASSSNYTTIRNNWNIIQSNVDVFKGATANSTGTSGLVPTPGAGEQSQYLRADGKWSSIAQSEVSNLTTDLNAKAPKANPTFTGIVTLPSTSPTASTQATPKGYVDTRDNAILMSAKEYTDDLVAPSEYIIKIPITKSTVSSTTVIPQGALITDVIVNINASYNKEAKLSIIQGATTTSTSTTTTLFNTTKSFDNGNIRSNIKESIYLETKESGKITVIINDATSGKGTVYVKVVNNTLS